MQVTSRSCDSSPRKSRIIRNADGSSPAKRQRSASFPDLTDNDNEVLTVTGGSDDADVEARPADIKLHLLDLPLEMQRKIMLCLAEDAASTTATAGSESAAESRAALYRMRAVCRTLRDVFDSLWIHPGDCPLEASPSCSGNGRTVWSIPRLAMNATSGCRDAKAASSPTTDNGSETSFVDAAYGRAKGGRFWLVSPPLAVTRLRLEVLDLDDAPREWWPFWREILGPRITHLKVYRSCGTVPSVVQLLAGAPNLQRLEFDQLELLSRICRESHISSANEDCVDGRRSRIDVRRVSDCHVVSIMVHPTADALLDKQDALSPFTQLRHLSIVNQRYQSVSVMAQLLVDRCPALQALVVHQAPAPGGLLASAISRWLGLRPVNDDTYDGDANATAANVISGGSDGDDYAPDDYEDEDDDDDDDYDDDGSDHPVPERQPPPNQQREKPQPRRYLPPLGELIELEEHFRMDVMQSSAPSSLRRLRLVPSYGFRCNDRPEPVFRPDTLALLFERFPNLIELAVTTRTVSLERIRLPDTVRTLTLYIPPFQDTPLPLQRLFIRNVHHEPLCGHTFHLNAPRLERLTLVSYYRSANRCLGQSRNSINGNGINNGSNYIAVNINAPVCLRAFDGRLDALRELNLEDIRFHPTTRPLAQIAPRLERIRQTGNFAIDLLDRKIESLRLVQLERLNVVSEAGIVKLFEQAPNAAIHLRQCCIAPELLNLQAYRAKDKKLPELSTRNCSTLTRARPGLNALC